jgi:diguanylate cyclase (GGDEF)-like protein
VTFRGRLTVFFAAIVLAPLVAGAVVVHALAARQAVHEADERLAAQEVPSVRAEERVSQDVRFHVTRTLAVRALRASPHELDAIRRTAGLGFLLAIHSGRITAKALGTPRFPSGSGPSPAQLAGDVSDLPVKARRMEVTGPPAGVVVGGDYLDQDFLDRLGASMLVADGRVVATNVGRATPSEVPSGRSFDLSGGRALCVCTGRPPTGIVLVTWVRSIGLLPSLPPPILVLLVVGAILAAILAIELARVLSKPHERALIRLVETEYLSMTDPLTGIPNRRRLESILADEARRAARFDRQFSVLMVDVDRFKLVNDVYGHAVGDRVLIEVAERTRRALRTDLDTVARFGGEEFTVILPETPREGALVVAEKIRSAIAATEFPEGLVVTVSVGVASRPEDGTTPDDLLRAADKALYEAKRSGRDRVAVAVR